MEQKNFFDMFKTSFGMQLLFNSLIAVLSVAGTVLQFIYYGFSAFLHYTVLSNILLCFACGVFAYWNILCLTSKRRYTPTWIKCFKYFAVVSSTVTLLVVIFALAPMSMNEETSYLRALSFYVLTAPMLFHHVLCPLLGLFSLLFIDNVSFKDKKFPWLAILPTFIYGLVFTVLNISNVVDGPYPFLRVHNQPLFATLLWDLALLSVCYIVGLVIALICNRRNKRMKQNDDSLLTEDMGYSEDGYITNQDCFHDMTYRTIAASENGCGPVAIYNICHANHQEVSFREVVREMDLMHFLAVPGPTRMHVMRKYLGKYMSGYSEEKGREECLQKCLTSNKGIIKYLEGSIPHFVAFIHSDNDSYRFFNVNDDMEDGITTMDEFFQSHVLDSKIHLFYW